MIGPYPAFPVRGKPSSGYISHGGEISRTRNTRGSAVAERFSSTSRSGHPSTGNHEGEEEEEKEGAIPGYPSPIIPRQRRRHASPRPSLDSFIDDRGNEMSEREIADQQEGFGWSGEDIWSDWADVGRDDVVDEEDHPPRGRTRYRHSHYFTAGEELGRRPLGQKSGDDISGYHTAQEWPWSSLSSPEPPYPIRMLWTGRGWNSAWPAFVMLAFTEGAWKRAGPWPVEDVQVTAVLVPRERADLISFFLGERWKDAEMFRLRSLWQSLRLGWDF
ncbi:MAG: hypothetical protein LQ352_006622 [Teloschistes flavicans]|nr:MAG: hypothetical protein LQ352_006622 [Teloschistes flavicans]